MTKLFSKVYNKVILWSGHPRAIYYLIGVSFTEACIFPIPPDVMLISMSLAKPKKALTYAWVTTISSVAGGMVGFILGAFFFNSVGSYILYFGYSDAFNEIAHWYSQWGFWVVLIVGFSPIPYKLFTIASGFFHMAFFPFVAASLISRGARFFLVATCLYFFGEKVRDFLAKSIDLIGWNLIAIIIVVYLLFKLINY